VGQSLRVGVLGGRVPGEAYCRAGRKNPRPPGGHPTAVSGHVRPGLNMQEEAAPRWQACGGASWVGCTPGSRERPATQTKAALILGTHLNA
jgi:hypothetical protein